jgi:heme-degrading monooxygenase HmoA
MGELQRLARWSDDPETKSLRPGSFSPCDRPVLQNNYISGRATRRLIGDHVAMVVIAFRSKLTSVAGDDYGKMAQEMDAHARTFPGFIDVKAFKAEDGERLTMVWWQDEETLRAWASDLRHREAQKLGRDKWYEYYKIEVAQIIRSKTFERKGESAAAHHTERT